MRPQPNAHTEGLPARRAARALLSSVVEREQPLDAALAAYTARRYQRCLSIAEGSATIGRWEQDRSLPIDPDAVRLEVAMAASQPL